MNIQSVGKNPVLGSIDTKKTDLDFKTEPNFSKVISDAIGKVNDAQVTADNKVEGFINGENVSMHEVMLAMQESQISMQLLIEVRNKIVEAYQEVNRIQL